MITNRATELLRYVTGKLRYITSTFLTPSIYHLQEGNRGNRSLYEGEHVRMYVSVPSILCIYTGTPYY